MLKQYTCLYRLGQLADVANLHHISTNLHAFKLTTPARLQLTSDECVSVTCIQLLLYASIPTKEKHFKRFGQLRKKLFNKFSL